MTWHELREETKTQKKIIEHQAEEIKKLKAKVGLLQFQLNGDKK